MWPFTKDKRLDTIIEVLLDIRGKEERIMGDLTALKAEIADAVTVISEALDALSKIPVDDQAGIDQATADLKAAVDSLKAKVAPAA